MAVCASLCFFSATLFLGAAILFLMAPDNLQSFGFNPKPRLTTRLPGFGLFALVATFFTATGLGLWNLKRWGRFLFAMLIFSVVTDLMRPIERWRLVAVSAGVSLLVFLWSSPSMKAAFGDRRIDREP